VRWSIAWIVVVAVAAVGCQKSKDGATLSEYKAKRTAVMERQKEQRTEAAAEKPAVEDEAGLGVVEGSYSYEPLGRRDPFRSFILDRLKQLGLESKGPLEEFDLSQLSVVAVVWDAPRRRALVEDPSGRGYIVHEGTAIGKNEGQVIRIDDNLVLVRETYVDYVGEKTLKDIPMRVRQAQGG
jgi:type IV pilus assembly protein PilP